MIGNKRVLAIITARGDSKGIPRKNIAPLAGKPLLAWTFEAASNARLLDRVILSSDNSEIIEVYQNLGGEVPFVRPAELARDDTPGVAPVFHALETLDESFDVVVLLQPTSPLRTAADIDEGLRFFAKSEAPCCVSVTPAPKAAWTFCFGDASRLVPVLPDFAEDQRQKGTSLFSANGALYIADIPWLVNSRTFYTPETAGFPMPVERSVDVDDPIDLLVCEEYLRRRRQDS